MVTEEYPRERPWNCWAMVATSGWLCPQTKRAARSMDRQVLNASCRLKAGLSRISFRLGVDYCYKTRCRLKVELSCISFRLGVDCCYKTRCRLKVELNRIYFRLGVHCCYKARCRLTGDLSRIFFRLGC